MSDTRFTPGPWFVATGCSWRRILQERTDAPVIVPTKSQHDGHPDLMGGEANLQLAAAAPDLYAALEDLCNYHAAQPHGLSPAISAKVARGQAALAKARGES